MVETALCLPLLLLFLTGILDWGWYFLQWDVLLDAAKDGVRFAVATPEGDDPVARAEEQARSIVLDNAVVRMSVQVEAEEVTVGATTGISLTLSQSFSPLVGLVPLPKTMQVTRVMALES